MNVWLLLAVCLFWLWFKIRDVMHVLLASVLTVDTAGTAPLDIALSLGLLWTVSTLYTVLAFTKSRLLTYQSCCRCLSLTEA